MQKENKKQSETKSNHEWDDVIAKMKKELMVDKLAKEAEERKTEKNVVVKVRVESSGVKLSPRSKEEEEKKTLQNFTKSVIKSKMTNYEDWDLNSKNYNRHDAHFNHPLIFTMYELYMEHTCQIYHEAEQFVKMDKEVGESDKKKNERILTFIRTDCLKSVRMLLHMILLDRDEKQILKFY